MIPPGFIPGHYQEITFRRRSMSNETLRDRYNDLWNRYREHRGMPIRNRAVASIREHDIVSRFPERPASQTASSRVLPML